MNENVHETKQNKTCSLRNVLLLYFFSVNFHKAFKNEKRKKSLIWWILLIIIKERNLHATQARVQLEFLEKHKKHFDYGLNKFFIGLNWKKMTKYLTKFLQL